MRSISKHGFQHVYLSASGHVVAPGAPGTAVTLQRSRPFRMDIPAHQAAFYRLLVRLLMYLFSGASKVGYINMDLWNPLFRGIQGPVQVSPPAFPPPAIAVFVSAARAVGCHIFLALIHRNL